MERLDDVRADPAQEPAWEAERDEAGRVAQRQTNADVQDVLPLLTGDARRWAEAYLAEARKLDEPVTSYQEAERPELIRATDRRLDWSRPRGEQARAVLGRELARRHLERAA